MKIKFLSQHSIKGKKRDQNQNLFIEKKIELYRNLYAFIYRYKSPIVRNTNNCDLKTIGFCGVISLQINFEIKIKTK